MAGTIDRLQKAVLKARGNPTSSRTARLLRAGSGKIGKEVGEEMAPLVVEAMQNHRMPVVRRSADLLYNLTLLWASVGVDPKHVWNEMNRRERVAKQRGFVEKRRKVPKWP
jgi:phosphoribosyl-ATP pyrophosphohydrolase